MDQRFARARAWALQRVQEVHPLRAGWSCRPCTAPTTTTNPSGSASASCARGSGSRPARPSEALGRAARLPEPRAHEAKPIPEGLLVVVGANGEGKTNLLEGMHFLYALQSPTRERERTTGAPRRRPAFVRGEFQTRRRQGARRGRGQDEGREQGAGEPLTGATPPRSAQAGAFGVVRPVRPAGDHRRPVATARVHGRGRRRAGAGVRHSSRRPTSASCASGTVC